MLLADMGADVIAIERLTPHGLGVGKERRFDTTLRNRSSVAVNLKTVSGRQLALRLLADADALIEGNRPGVMERLGLGPEECLAVNPRLVYGRVTGWGQEGPLARTVGHDLNYLALSGMLSLIGPRERPAIPLNFLGDYAGGGLYLALGVLAAMNEAGHSGRGQVVDAAMIDGLGSLMTHHAGYIASERWRDEREANFIDGAAPWYAVYETRDGGFVSVAAVEPKFFRTLVQALGLDPETLPDPLDREAWPKLRQEIAEVFRSATRDEWCDRLEGLEACFAPVLSVAEAAEHPHMRARSAHVELAGVRHPAPAPRFQRTPSVVTEPPHEAGADTDTVLRDAGLSEDEIGRMREEGAIG